MKLIKKHLPLIIGVVGGLLYGVIMHTKQLKKKRKQRCSQCGEPLCDDYCEMYCSN